MCFLMVNNGCNLAMLPGRMVDEGKGQHQGHYLLEEEGSSTMIGETIYIVVLIVQLWIHLTLLWLYGARSMELCCYGAMECQWYGFICTLRACF